MIRFRLDARSGVPIYRQMVDQVRQAVRLGLLRPGDRLPTVREVVGHIPVNPNTVHRAYRDLEAQGVVEGKTGLGTFVLRSLRPVPPEVSDALRAELASAIAWASAAGLDEESIDACYTAAKTDASNRTAPARGAGQASTRALQRSRASTQDRTAARRAVP